MAEFNSQENKLNKGYSEAKAFLGGQNSEEQLISDLKNSLLYANGIDIIVSFLMESGVKLLINVLKEAINKGTKIRILTGSYLNITQPSALYLIKNALGENVDLRFYNNFNVSFHPKAYIFHYDNWDEIYIGSSNLSKSALTNGIEWNYRFNSALDSINYGIFYDAFEKMFNDNSILIDEECLKNYSENWHQPQILKNVNFELLSDVNFEPRGAQIEALHALSKSREEGADKALIVAATGVGKTYLAAFDSFKFKRVLFVAHRHEILLQAAESFKNVRKSNDYGFFDSDNKVTDKSVIFASVGTLGKSEYLNNQYFSSDYFDYIVIDEFHHAVSSSYVKIINYFKPKFLLGLTATPERLDCKNIYELCDYNVPYEIDLKDAINRGMLVPFRYYGIYDDTDYSNIRFINGKYNQDDLNAAYINNLERNDSIIKNYKKYDSKKALGFCCSRKHAEAMAHYFNGEGIPSIAVYSGSQGENSIDRDAAIEALNCGRINVVFSVDMFNEGVDIPDVDMVMFLRPTESPTIFLQQLGRGLRIAPNKEYLNVLDFIGNYHKAGLVRFLLSDQKQVDCRSGYIPRQVDLPDDCIVDFDLRLIDLFEKMDAKQITIKDKIIQEYERVENIIGNRPSRMELFTLMDEEIYQLCLTTPKDNPFRNYFGFLNSINRLTDYEKDFIDTFGYEFLHHIETTNMQKVYKMPVLNAFYNNGNVKMRLSEQDLLNSWLDFFNRGTNWKDLFGEDNYEKYQTCSKRSHLSNILRNPVHFLIKSGSDFFEAQEGFPICLNDKIKPYIANDIFLKQFKDIIYYRTIDYYKRRYHSNSNH